jgi:hypothetical protein|tara:strand:+ start:221 stop:439 length:219 start_codon:yes stop_codon:yes gene_type:complete
MADVIKELQMFSQDEQEFVLEHLAHKYHPIEIDGEMFMIPDEVHNLINSLVVQISEREIINLKKNLSGKANS